MSLIVTIVAHDGIVLASDSRTTQSHRIGTTVHSYPLTDSANKTFLTNNRFGISMCGEASVDGYPISSFIQRFIDSYVSNESTRVIDFTNDLYCYLKSLKFENDLILHIAGYEKNGQKYNPYICRCLIEGKTKELRMLSQENDDNHIIWDGVSETINRLINQQIVFDECDTLKTLTINQPDGTTKTMKDVFVIEKSKCNYFPKANISIFTLQDAIDFARYAIRTTIDTLRFLSTEKTVGGAIDVLVIKPFEAIWINKKELK